jgi:hypothetical protein
VPCVGVDDADHPVRGDLPGDPPPRRVTRIVRIDQLDVLPGDQREQPDGVRRRPGSCSGSARARQGVRDEGVDQRVAGGLSFQAIRGLPGSS